MKKEGTESANGIKFRKNVIPSQFAFLSHPRVASLVLRTIHLLGNRFLKGKHYGLPHQRARWFAMTELT